MLLFPLCGALRKIHAAIDGVNFLYCSEGDGGDGDGGGDGSDGANAAAAAGLGVSDNANDPGADDTSGESIGQSALSAQADAQASLNAMASQYGDVGTLGLGVGNIGGFGFGPSIGSTGISGTGNASIGAAQGTDAGSLGMGFGNIGGFTSANEGFGIPGVNLGFDDTGALSQATINSQAEQDAINAVMGIAPPGLSHSTPASPFGSIAAPPTSMDAELGLNAITAPPPAPQTAIPSQISVDQTGLFGIAPTVNAPSPFGQQASFAIAPETSVQENMTGLLGMTLDEQQAAIDAKDAKEAKEAQQEETSPKSFEQQAINIAMQQALEAKNVIDGILGTPATPQATPTAPATASFTGFSQSPPGVVGVAPPASMTATGFSPSPPGVVGVAPPGMTATGFSPSPPGTVGVPGTPGFTGLGVDPDNPAPPTTPVDPDNPAYSPPLGRPAPITEETLPNPAMLSPQVQVPMPVSRPDAANLPNAGIVGPPTSLDTPPSGVIGPPTGPFGQAATPPTSFSNTTGLVGPAVNAFGQMAAVAASPASMNAQNQVAPSPLGVLPSPVTSQQFTQSQQQALQQLSEPAKGPTLAENLGLSRGTLGTGITGFTPGSSLANIAATNGPVAAAAVAAGFPATAAIAMQSLYSIPV